jgi:hypothetical protein
MEDNVHHTLYDVLVLSFHVKKLVSAETRQTMWCSYRTELSVDKRFRFFNRELSKANLYQFDSCRFKAKVSISIFDYLALEKKNNTQKRLYNSRRDRGIKLNFEKLYHMQSKKDI